MAEAEAEEGERMEEDGEERADEDEGEDGMDVAAVEAEAAAGGCAMSG